MIAPLRPRCSQADGERIYALTDGKAGKWALARVGAAFEICADAATDASRSYYDTFDRRLAEARRMLCVHKGAGDRVLRLESLSGMVVRRLVTREKPAFVVDLPPGPFRDALEPIVEVRKLLPVARLRGRVRPLSVMGKGGKTIVRLAYESWTAAPPLLRVTPVRGYEKAARAVIEHLEGEMHLAPLSEAAVAKLLGLAPVDDEGAPTWPPLIQPGMRCDGAARVIYCGLLATMRVNEEGVRARIDPEFLHEYRVALRRTRAGLSRLKGVFPSRQVERFKRDFAWLGDATGRVRDIDVQLLEVPAYEASLPRSARTQLEPLRTWLGHEGDRAQRDLIKVLDSVRYERLISAWAAFLDREPPTRTSLPDAARAVEEVARERIWKLHTRVVRRGLAIDAHTAAASVHDLRLDGKKLRYLLEFFRRLFPAKEIKGQIAALKQLQDVLGRFNDFEVQQGALQHAATSIGSADPTSWDSVLVMGRIVESLRGQQNAARAEVTGRVAAYAAAEPLARAEALFAPRTQEQHR